jgi:hypothetical protein
MFRTSPKLLAGAAALVVLGVACGTAVSIEISRVQKADVKVLPGASGFTNPLTGVTAYTPQDWQTRPALGIKVGNSVNERPQSGVDSADIVYEEIVEGGVTRFLAIFLTNQSTRVGPVRSVRTVDHKILQPINALFVYSGGVPPVISELRGTPGVTDVGANVVGGAYRRDGNREAPYNLYTATDQLWTGRTGEPPKPQFEFLKSDEDPAAGGQENANEVKLSFAGNSAQVRYVFDKQVGRYERYNGEAAHMVEGAGGGTHLAFSNVLIQMVDVTAGSTIDRAGERSTDIKMLGSGSAVLFRGGKALRGRWERAGVNDVTRFVSSEGQTLKLAPGTTIIELLPNGRDIFVT